MEPRTARIGCFDLDYPSAVGCKRIEGISGRSGTTRRRRRLRARGEKTAVKNGKSTATLPGRDRRRGEAFLVANLAKDWGLALLWPISPEIGASPEIGVVLGAPAVWRPQPRSGNAANAAGEQHIHSVSRVSAARPSRYDGYRSVIPSSARIRSLETRLWPPARSPADPSRWSAPNTAGGVPHSRATSS
jgi:hypothetical protein